jgi:glycogen(starch) synthase
LSSFTVHTDHIPPHLNLVYTVIKTKAPVTVAEYKSRYCLIGPLSYKSAPMEVEATEPSTPEMRATLKSMSDKGVKYLYGRWLIEGGPNVLLFDTGSMMSRLDEWKSDLWNLAGIPTPPSDSETNETVVFGYMVAWFLGEVSCSLLYFLLCILHSLLSRSRLGP